MRSYIVEAKEGKTLRRNRKFLRPTSEKMSYDDSDYHSDINDYSSYDSVPANFHIDPVDNPPLQPTDTPPVNSKAHTKTSRGRTVKMPVKMKDCLKNNL